MAKTALSVVAALLAGMASAAAKENCDKGFQNFLTKMTVFLPTTGGRDIADAVRKSLDAYDSCEAGDTFSPRGVWDQILADMEKKSKG